MCLNGILTQKDKKAWMKGKPEIITAYKVVRQRMEKIEKIYPIYFSASIPFEKTNKLSKKKSKDRVETGFNLLSVRSTYRPYYHLFIDRKEALRWAEGISQRVVLKCEVPKKQITVVGTQSGSEVIITKEFTFIEGRKYFKEEKQCA